MRRTTVIGSHSKALEMTSDLHIPRPGSKEPADRKELQEHPRTPRSRCSCVAGRAPADARDTEAGCRPCGDHVEIEARSCSRLPPPYSSEIQQPMRTTAALGRHRHTYRAAPLIASRIAPVVCIQILSIVQPAHEQRCSLPLVCTAELSRI